MTTLDSRTVTAEDAKRYVEEQFPVNVTGQQLALVLNTLSFVVSIALGHPAAAQEMWQSVAETLTDLGREPTQEFLHALARVMAGRFHGTIGDVDMLNPATLEAQAILGGTTAPNAGGLVS